MKQNTIKQPLEDKKRYVPYGINGMYYIYDNVNHFMIPGQAGSSSRRMIKRKCEQLNHEENTPPTPDSKEGLHTQGEWVISGETDIVVKGKYKDRYVALCSGGTILPSLEEIRENKANAELIVKAVNERKALLDALKDTLMLAEELKFESEKAYQICETAKKLINNAKNI